MQEFFLKPIICKQVAVHKIVQDRVCLDALVFHTVDEIARHASKHIMVEERLIALLPVREYVYTLWQLEVRKSSETDFNYTFLHK